MEFKPDKCEELHTGRSNVWGTSTVGSRNLGSNDLQCAGPQFYGSGNTNRIDRVVKKASGLLAFISWDILCNSLKANVQVYKMG